MEDICAYVDPASSAPKEEEMPGDDRFPAAGLPEIWLNVFNKLDRTDKLAFTGASSVWHDWVERKRTQSLLSEIAPYHIETLPQRNLLQCRELCQSWKEELDHQTQTHPSNTSLHFEIASGEGPSRWHPTRRSFQFENFFMYVENVEEFLEEMRNHPGNPFPGRSISLMCNVDGEDERVGRAWNLVWREYWTRNISLLLQNFGSHVHFAEIWFGVENDELEQVGDDMQIEVHLRNCLLCLPNLKQLWLCGEDGSRRQEDGLREYYRLNPLPRLEHLETLELNYTTPTGVEAILYSCCVPTNIKRLSYRHGRPYYERLRFSKAVDGFVNLEVLKAPILLRHLERLASLEQRPRLRELDLTFEDDPYFQDVFSVLELFGESLIQFRASSRMRLRNDPGNEEPFTCNLPHLKKLYFVEYWGSPDSI